MAMQLVLTALVATAAALHNPGPDALKKAILEEVNMGDMKYAERSESQGGFKLRVLEDEAAITVKKGEDGLPVCQDTCRGDPSDMSHPFYRYTKDLGPKHLDSFTVANDTHFFNVADARQCLKDKYVLFLGDSTLSENLNDMEFLLAGGPQKVKLESFMWAVATQTKSKLSWDTDKGSMHATYFYRNRQKETTYENGARMKFYFIGATKLTENCGGISSMLDAHVQTQVAAFIKDVGRKPDVIVMTSGAHDNCHAWLSKDQYSSFYESIEEVGKRVIKPWSEQGIKFLWRGSYMFPGEKAVDNPSFGDTRIPKKVEEAAKQTVEKYGGQYLDMSKVLGTTHDDSGCCGKIADTTVAMPHLGSIEMFKNKKASVFVSQLMTYKILDAICPAEV